MPKDIDRSDLKRLDQAFGFTSSGNSEVLNAWFQLTIPAGYNKADKGLEAFAEFKEEIETEIEEEKDNIYGNLWAWSNSNYTPYKKYKPYEGNLGEYNNKFMCNQFVLKGGSHSTPKSHVRASYRNFYYPNDRWQFSGVRLADYL